MKDYSIVLSSVHIHWESDHGDGAIDGWTNEFIFGGGGAIRNNNNAMALSNSSGSGRKSKILYHCI